MLRTRLPRLAHLARPLHSLSPTLLPGRGLATQVVASKPRLVILGSGWGGYNLARKVDKNLYDVSVVSPNSFFSFTPFLASTCVGTLEFQCATEPVRGIKNLNYYQGWAESVDFDKKTIKIDPALPALVPGEEHVPGPSQGAELSAGYTPGDAYEIGYDKLVIATGCRSAWFNTPGVLEHAKFLKDVREARAIRRHLLYNLELACKPGVTPEQRKRLLSFRIVGGGPTGVEFAAELHDFIEQDVYRIYPQLKGQVDITLYDTAPGILGGFDASLRGYAEKKFSRDGVTVRGNSRVTAVGPDWIELQNGERVPYGLLVWNTGLAINEFVKDLKGVSKDSKSIKVGPHLEVLDENGEVRPGVFAIGDNSTPADGNKLPATAQVASQMAGYMSSTLKSVATGSELSSLPDFHWKNRGSMVFIGDYKAMVDRTSKGTDGFRARISGFVAWLVWRSYYVTLAMGWRNKLLIPMYWTLNFFFGRDVTNY